MRRLLFISPAVLIIAIYFATLSHGKVWDDWLMLGDFTMYRDVSYWPLVLQSPLPFSQNYFRPAVVLTFLIEAYFSASDGMSHLVNILIHCLNSVLVLLVCLKLWPEHGNGKGQQYRYLLATGVAILFGLHQVMAEGVVWLVGRFDLMATTFSLLAILADIGLRSPLRKTLVVCLMFLLGLFCKEMAVTVPVVLLLLHAARSDQRGLAYLFSRERIVLYASLTLTLAIYLGIRYAALGYLLKPDPEMAFLPFGSALQRLLLIGAAFSGYLNVMLMPGAISPLHFQPIPIPVGSLAGWIGLALLAALAGAIVVLVRRSQTRMLGYCLAATLVSLLPVMQILPAPMLLANTVYADRAAILPLAFLLLGLGHFATTASTSKQLGYGIFGAALWVALMVPVVLAVFPVWKYDLSLWTYLAAENPTCSYCHSKRASLMVYAGPPEQALKVADLAVVHAAQPWQTADALSVRAGVLVKLNRFDEAIASMVAAENAEPVIAAKSSYALRRAGMLISQNRLEEARRILVRVAQTEDKGGPMLIQQLGQLALATDRPDLARGFFAKSMIGAPGMAREAVRKRTDDPAAWRRMGDMMSKAGQAPQAAAAYAEAERLERLAAARKPASPPAIPN